MQVLNRHITYHSLWCLCSFTIYPKKKELPHKWYLTYQRLCAQNKGKNYGFMHFIFRYPLTEIKHCKWSVFNYYFTTFSVPLIFIIWSLLIFWQNIKNTLWDRMHTGWPSLFKAYLCPPGWTIIIYYVISLCLGVMGLGVMGLSHHLGTRFQL